MTDTKPCCDHDHVRPCGPVPGNPPKDEPGYEPICACGCSGYDERCGDGGEWWHDPYAAIEIATEAAEAAYDEWAAIPCKDRLS